MRTYNFAPLWRSSIGFDRLFDLLDATQRANEEGSPPYDIERVGEDSYRISLALAGYAPENVSLTAEQNVLTVEGRKDEQKRDLLYKGISARSFKRQFNLAEHVTVTEAHFRQRSAADQLEARSAGGHEAAPHPDRTERSQ